MKFRLLFGLILTCFLLSTASYAKNEQIKEKSVHAYTLANGLTLLVKEDHRAPVVISQVWYKVGSSYEPNGITGISHVLEHMMFKGTPSNPNTAFFDKIAAVGGEQNAFTAYDYTAYWQKLSSDQLPLSFQLEADRMQNLSLPEDEFKKEIEVVKEERQLSTDNDPESLTFERFMAAANIASPYHHPIIGWQSDLNNMTIHDVKNWYQTWYTPNNATVIVIGDVNHTTVFELAQQYFGPIPAKKLPEIKPHPEVRGLGIRTLTVKAPAKVPNLLMGFNTPSLLTAKNKWEPYALEVLATILNGGNSSRLQKELVREKEIAVKVSTSYDLYSRLAGLFLLSGTPSNKHTIKDLKKALLQQIKTLQQQPVSSQELSRIKAQTIANKIYSQDSIVSQSIFLGVLTSIGLPWEEYENYSEQVKKVTAEQILAVAKKYLVQDNLTLAVLKPQPL